MSSEILSILPPTRPFWRWIAGCAVAGGLLATPAGAQDNEAASPVATDMITLEGVVVDGQAYDRVTISSEGQLRVTFGDPQGAQHCDRGQQLISRPHFGRNGALTTREIAMAEAAWAYFEKNTQDGTGLANAVGNFPSTTMWDTASYISGLVAAYELCLINKREFDTRATKLLNTLRNLKLFRNEAPNKVYDTRDGTMVNYANEPGEVGVSANDLGRMLVWLKILKERYPYLANSVDSVPMRWNFCNIIPEDGRMFGSFVQGDGATRYVQEGRLGYEEYAAKGFALWGFDVDRALEPQPVAYTEIFGVRVPHDGRDPRVFKSKNYVLTESYLLDGLEMGWDLPDDQSNDGAVASDGWRAEFANRIYLAQQRRFEQTGILTARSEHQVNGAPYFVYDTIYADGYAWNTLDPTGEYQPDRAAIAAKAAIGMWALWETDYTDLLFESVADLSDPDAGFYEGLYENGNGYIPLQTANNNGIILAALLYKAQGPILQHQNENTQLWETSYAGTDIRGNKCHPDLLNEVIECGCCDGYEPEPAIPAEEFLYCQPLVDGGDVAATNCSLEEHNLEPPKVRRTLSRSCRAPGGN